MVTTKPAVSSSLWRMVPKCLQLHQSQRRDLTRPCVLKSLSSHCLPDTDIRYRTAPPTITRSRDSANATKQPFQGQSPKSPKIKAEHSGLVQRDRTAQHADSGNGTMNSLEVSQGPDLQARQLPPQRSESASRSFIIPSFSAITHPDYDPPLV